MVYYVAQKEGHFFFFGDFMSSSGLLLPSPPPCSDAVVQSLAEHFEATLATTAAAVSVSCKGPPWKVGNVEGRRWLEMETILNNAGFNNQPQIQHPPPNIQTPFPTPPCELEGGWFNNHLRFDSYFWWIVEWCYYSLATLFFLPIRNVKSRRILPPIWSNISNKKLEVCVYINI